MRDVATVTVCVDAEPALAFEIFTREIDLWWRSGPRFRIGGKHPGHISFECKAEGRLFQTVSLPSGPRAIEVGRITAWEPPDRLVFDWRGVNFAPEEKTEVEVCFVAYRGAERAGTRVTVSHRGWSRLRADHPARHAEGDAQFIRRTAMWWGDLATALREHVRDRSSGRTGGVEDPDRR